MEIKIQDPTGASFFLKVKRTETIKNVKEKINLLRGIPVNEQILSNSQNVFKDYSNLEECNVCKESTVFLRVNKKTFLPKIINENGSTIEKEKEIIKIKEKGNIFFKKKNEITKTKLGLKSVRESSLKLGFKGLAPLPHRLNTIERVRADTELQRVFRGKYGKKYNFIPCGEKESGSACGNIYGKDHTNPNVSKKKPKSRWLGKIGLQRSESGVFGTPSSGMKSEIKNEREMNASVVLEYIANNIYRVLGDGMFETTKMRLSKLPIVNKFLKDNSFANYIVNEFKVTKSLRVMCKWSNYYHDLSNLMVVHEQKYFKFMDFVENFGRIPEKVLVLELQREVEIYGIAGLLAASTSIGDIDVFGGGGKNTGYVCEKNDKGEIERIRIVKIDPGFSFSFDQIRKNIFEDPRDIRYCPQDVKNGIKWKLLTEKQRNEFLEVKLHQLELIKDEKIFDYLFYRDGKFNRSDTEKIDKDISNNFIKKLVDHIKNEGEMYEKDLFEYKKIRFNVLWEESKLCYFRGDFDRDLCLKEKLIDLCDDTSLIGICYNNLGAVYQKKGEYSKAIENFQKSLNICLKVLPSDHPNIAVGYRNLGIVFIDKGEYSKANEYIQKSLNIFLKVLPSNHPDIAASYNNLGGIFQNKGEYSKAIENFKKSLSIRLKALPSDHPNIADSYNNLGVVFEEKGDYSKAIQNFQKSLNICIKVLPSDHPDIGVTYNNLGNVFQSKGEYSKALENYQKSLNIYLKVLPSDHPNIAGSYKNLGNVFKDKGEYSKALEYCQKSLNICLKVLPSDHPEIAASYNNLGEIFRNKGEYSKAIENFRKSLNICLKVLPYDHPDIAGTYNNLGIVFQNRGEHSKAIENYQKSLKIYLKVLPSDHPNIAVGYSNLGVVFSKKGEYSKAIENYQKTLNIRLKVLPSNHPDIAETCNNLGEIFQNKGEYSKAIENFQKSLSIRLKALPSDHPDIAITCNNLGIVFQSRGEYSKAIENHQKSINIRIKILPSDHPDIAVSYNNLGKLFHYQGEYSKAIENFQKCLNIRLKVFPSDHPNIASTYNNLGVVFEDNGEYTKAIENYRKALEIYEKKVSSVHSIVKLVKDNIQRNIMNQKKLSIK